MWLELKAHTFMNTHEVPGYSLMSHLVLIRPWEPICLQFRMILPRVGKKKTKNPKHTKQIWLRVSCSERFFLLLLGFFFLLLLALLGQCNWITEITSSNSCLQLNYAETRLSQLENCHCEKTCQVSGLLYRDQDSWVDGDHCRNCTCKVRLFINECNKASSRGVVSLVIVSSGSLI